MLRKIYTYEDVVQFVSQTECVLLSDSFKNTKQKLKFKCKCGNIFTKGFLDFKRSARCKKCGNNQTGLKLKLGFDDFLKKAKKVHGEFFDYSKVVFVKWADKVEIICPIHGSFFQSPCNHTTCGSGCNKCGIEKIRQLNTKKDDWETSKKHIEDAIEFFGGEFPTHKLLVKHRLQDAIRVINKFGGICAIREKFGFNQLQQPRHYWKNWDNVLSFLNEHFPLLIKAGTCPTQKMMRSTGIDPSSLLIHHGGIEGICKKLNLTPATCYKTRDGHFVRSYYELLLDEYLYSRNIEHTPEFKPFENYNYRCDQKVGDFYIEIWGYPPKCKFYHQKRLKKEDLYKKFGLKLISIEYDFFNGNFYLLEHKLNDIFNKMGYSTNALQSFSISDLTKLANVPWTEETIKQYIESYIVEYGEFPSQKKLRKCGFSSLAARIDQFGGFNYFRKLMGYGKYVKQNCKWSVDKITNDLTNICNITGEFPKDKDLPSELKNAVYRSHHDLNWYKEKLGYVITKKSKGYWTEDIIEKELKDVINKSGDIFPTNLYLISIKRHDLTSAIQNNGGFNFWREKLGFGMHKNSPNQ